MNRKIELLVPGGDIDAIKAAIVAGADAIYCGLDRFNARNRAENIRIKDLNGIIRMAHSNGCELFLTLNVIIVESEIPALIALLNKVVNTKVDGLIVQDFGLFYILSRYYPTLKVHASTQLTTHNQGQIAFLDRLKARRVNLSRELNLSEIATLTETAHKNHMLTEVFVHGSNCLSFSGICYLSSVHGGNSGNRGRCSQPCRDQYETTAEGKNFPLNIKDNSAFFDLKALVDTGVDSLKIEGRIKKFHYVYTVADSWRKQLQSLHDLNEPDNDDTRLHHVFNRGFSNAFLKGTIDKNLFVDNPRDHSAIHLAEIKGGATVENIEEAKRELYDLKTDIITDVRCKIERLSYAKAALQLSLSGESGTVLEVAVTTPETSFVVSSEINLVASVDNNNCAESLNSELLLNRFEQINETEYFIESLNIEGLVSGLYLPFKELTAIKKKILYRLNDSREFLPPIDVLQIKRAEKQTGKPTLSLLISSEEDLYLCNTDSGDTYFQLPDSLGKRSSNLADIFMAHRGLISWFPSVLIGDDYHAAVEFLQKVQPERIVTNNSGIAYECFQRGIPWIAGPYLNIVNSFSLLCLKEKMNCCGAFISNELKRVQLKAIKTPADFKLYYSIYHPILLMTSRQCLLHQVTGCSKERIDENCIGQCERSAAITNLKKISLLIKKTKGNHHTLYAAKHYLNTDIVSDMPGFFSSFLIDLRRIETDTRVTMATPELVDLFENYLAGGSGAAEKLQRTLSPSSNTQYVKGI